MNVPRHEFRFGALRLLVAVVAGLLLGTTRTLAQTQDDVTVAFLYNFARFVEWPAGTFAGANTPFTIGFVGRPALAQRFAQVVQGKTVEGRELVARKIDSPTAASECQILFVGESSEVDGMLRAVKGRPVLSVGEGEAFLAAGGMVAFSREGARLVFDLNSTAITQATLKPGDKLMKAARSNKGG